jgi:hypothetical protein
MANTVIQLRHSTLTGNVPSALANGEISINNRDGKFFYSTPAGAIITHYPYPGPAGLNQEVQFNDSGFLGSDSGLTYNKTTDVLTVVGGAIIGGTNVAPQIQFAYNHANAAFIQANTGGGGADQFARNTANAAFIRANNSLNANVGGNITGDVVVIGNLTSNTLTTTGSNGTISGANAIFSNYVFAANGTVDLFIYANNAYTTANGAFAAANAATTTNITQNNSITVALNTANAAFIHANAAFIQANTGGADQFARNQANAAFLQANTPSHVANSAAIYANGAFAAANAATATDVTQNNSITAAFIHANAAFAAANTGGGGADQYARNTANAAFLQANTAGIVYTAASVPPVSEKLGDQWYNTDTDILYEYINDGTADYWVDTSSSAINVSNGGATSSGADQFARNTANAAFIQANTPSYVANSAAIYANGAFAAANTAAIATTNSLHPFLLAGM